MSVKKAIQERKEDDYKDCMELTRKMEYLQKYPTGFNNYIYNLDDRYTNHAWIKMYYTGCDAFNIFVKDNNAKENGIKFVVHGQYVNFVRTHINCDNNKITYNLERGTDCETQK